GGAVRIGRSIGEEEPSLRIEGELAGAAEQVRDREGGERSGSSVEPIHRAFRFWERRGSVAIDDEQIAVRREEEIDRTGQLGKLGQERLRLTRVGVDPVDPAGTSAGSIGDVESPVGVELYRRGIDPRFS